MSSCLYCGEKLKEGETTCLFCGRAVLNNKKELTEDFLTKQTIK